MIGPCSLHHPFIVFPAAADAVSAVSAPGRSRKRSSCFSKGLNSHQLAPESNDGIVERSAEQMLFMELKEAIESLNQ